LFYKQRLLQGNAAVFFSEKELCKTEVCGKIKNQFVERIGFLQNAEAQRGKKEKHTMAQLWGGRFTKETDRLVYRFNSSISRI